LIQRNISPMIATTYFDGLGSAIWYNLRPLVWFALGVVVVVGGLVVWGVLAAKKGKVTEI
jgi:hypothetical protein